MAPIVETGRDAAAAREPAAAESAAAESSLLAPGAKQRKMTAAQIAKEELVQLVQPMITD